MANMIKLARCFQLFCLCLTIISSQVLDHRFFLVKLMEKYGHNGTISYEGFERLYDNLGLGQPVSVTVSPVVTVSTTKADVAHSRFSRHLDSYNIFETQEELAKLIQEHSEVLPVAESLRAPVQHCLSSQELLAVFGVSQTSDTLGPVSFLHLCPAIIYELDQRTCASSHGGGRAHSHDNSAGQATRQSSWLFAGLSVLLISASGMVSVALVPLLDKSFIKHLKSFLVAMAVGTLLGDAFLHLIPHALDSQAVDESRRHIHSVLVTGVMFLSVVFFFTIESTLIVDRNKKEKYKVQTNANYINVNTNQHEKEMLELGETHGHSHNPQNTTVLMVIMGDGLHNLTDGLAIGAAFGGGLAPGFATALAVFTHELPHELGDFAVLLQSGVSVRRALLYNIVSSVLSFLGTIFGLVIGNFGDFTKWVYAITAGVFIYIALSNVVPDMNRQPTMCRTIVLRLAGILTGGALMCCIAIFEHDIHNLFL